MNKKLNAFLRILTIAVAIAAVVFAILLKGKMEAAVTATNFAVIDKEINATKDYDLRMKELPVKVTALLDAKRKSVLELEASKKDLIADVADKKMKIDGLTASNTTLEGERAELTRKRDELAAQLTDANSKKDGAVAELATAKEELVKATEKVAAMFTKEQVAESETKATKAEEKSELIRAKYAALFGKVSLAMDNNPAPFGFPRDPLGEAAKPGDAPAANVVAAVEAATDTILTNIVALDAKSGIVAFSVGEANGIKEKAIFDVKIAGKKVGKVQISSVKGALSYGLIQPDKELDLAAISKAGAVSLSPSTKLAIN